MLFSGSFCGSLSSLKASDLGSIVIRESLARAHLKPTDVSEVILGQVKKIKFNNNNNNKSLQKLFRSFNTHLSFNFAGLDRSTGSKSSSPSCHKSRSSYFCSCLSHKHGLWIWTQVWHFLWMKKMNNAFISLHKNVFTKK